MIPKRMHAKNNSLSEATRSLSQGPRQNNVGVDHRDRPKPDLMSRLHTPVASRHRPLIHELAAVVNPGACDFNLGRAARRPHAASPARPASGEMAPAGTPRGRARRHPSRPPRPAAPTPRRGSGRWFLYGDRRLDGVSAGRERPGVGLALGVPFALVLDQLAGLETAQQA